MASLLGGWVVGAEYDRGHRWVSMGTMPPVHLVPWIPGAVVLWFHGPVVLWFGHTLVLWFSTDLCPVYDHCAACEPG